MKKVIRDVLTLCPFVILLALTCIYNREIADYLIETYIYYNKNVHIESSNEYKLNYNFYFVQNTNDFNVTNRKELLNALYTILNSGLDNFYFFCQYDECEKDLTDITDTEIMSYINNFVHPFNTYKKLYISVNNYNKIDITFIKNYSNVDIEMTNKRLDSIIDSIITDDMSDKEKIIVFHDYIIDHTRYDSEYINNNIVNLDDPSHNATGVLFYGKGLCGGYADVMSIFLNRLNIPNYLISSESHVWNAVYLNNSWYHLDLTWDDPVTSNGSNLKLDKFLLIDNKTLESYNTSYHSFDKNVYLEFQYR